MRVTSFEESAESSSTIGSLHLSANAGNAKTEDSTTAVKTLRKRFTQFLLFPLTMCRYGLGLFGFGQTGSETMANMRSIFSQVYFVGLAHEGDTKNQAPWGLGGWRGGGQGLGGGV